MKYAVGLLILTCLMGFTANITTVDLRNDLLGRWQYQYSWVDGRQMQIDPDVHLPVQVMVFSTCNDAAELKGFPPVVIVMRQKNTLKNIKCEIYIDRKLSDTYYPVATINNRIEIDGYGKKYKDSFTIDTLTKNRLVVSNGKVYDFDEKKYSKVAHLYIRK